MPTELAFKLVHMRRPTLQKLSTQSANCIGLFSVMRLTGGWWEHGVLRCLNESVM